MISHSFEKSAFLGEKARDQKFSDRINETSKKINIILNPIDPVAEKQANGKAAKMVEGLKEGNEWGCDNVRSLIEASQDMQRPQNQEVAKKRLEVLAYSTYIAMKHGGNADLETAVGAIDGGVVDAKLPDSLKGLGSLVVDIAVNQEINNPQLRGALKKLDRQANLLRVSGAVGEEKLKELIGNKILGLSELVDELDDDGYEELTRVSAYLGAEIEKNDKEEVFQEEFDKHRNNEERVRREAEELARIRQPKGPNTGDGEEFTPYEASYDMTKGRFVEMEYNMQPIRWYDERPPKWYEKGIMGDTDRDLIDLRLKILNAAGNKVYLRNRDIEKMRNNYPEISEREFGLLWNEMPGFKEALGGIVRDLCEEYKDDDGRLLLRLKTNGLDEHGKKKPKMDGNVQSKDKDGKLEWLEPNAIIDSVRNNLEHFYKYKADFENKLGNFEVLSKDELKKAEEENWSSDEINDLRIKVTEDRKREAVSAAWNFLYVGDSVESWDYFRELKPTVCVSDKMRTMDHPMIKALGKWGVWKGYMDSAKRVTPDGQEEPFVSGALSSWILDRINVEPHFKDRLISGDLKDMLPRTLVVSMIESTNIGSGDNETNIASALMKNNEQLITNHFKKKDTDKNLMQPHNDMVQGGEFILNLIKGKIQYAAGKNDGQFISDFIENTSLVRQEPNIPLVGGKLGTLASVDKPEFFKWSLMVALGFNPFDTNPLPNPQSLGATDNTYDIKMQGLLDKLTIRALLSKDGKKKLYKMFSASSLVEYKIAKMKNNQESVKRNR